jgi:hypothetical protein
MARKTQTTTPATEAPETPAPKTYTLTEKGSALTTRAGSHRAAAWALVVEHAGKPDGQAAVAKALKENPIGAITGTNFFGWARKAGLIA